jgi:hypothetical protein
MNYRKIDYTYLPEGYNTGLKYELYAEFYENGQLKTYGYYFKNRWKYFNLFLSLKREREEGEYVVMSIFGYEEYSVRYSNGLYDVYDCYHDDADPKKEDWIEWVNDMIKSIYKFSKYIQTRDLNNSATKEEMIEIEKRINAELRLGMDSNKADEIVYLSGKLSEKMLGSHVDKKNEGFYKIHHLREAYDIVLVSTLKSNSKYDSIISNFILLGEGWSKETRKKFAGHWKKDDPEIYKMFGIE